MYCTCQSIGGRIRQDAVECKATETAELLGAGVRARVTVKDDLGADGCVRPTAAQRDLNGRHFPAGNPGIHAR